MLVPPSRRLKVRFLLHAHTPRETRETRFGMRRELRVWMRESVKNRRQCYGTSKTYNSLKETDDGILVSELVRRAYEIASPSREHTEKHVNVVKIG